MCIRRKKKRQMTQCEQIEHMLSTMCDNHWLAANRDRIGYCKGEAGEED